VFIFLFPNSICFINLSLKSVRYAFLDILISLFIFYNNLILSYNQTKPGWLYRTSTPHVHNLIHDVYINRPTLLKRILRKRLIRKRFRQTVKLDKRG
jgi:hypothetical protein